MKREKIMEKSNLFLLNGLKDFNYAFLIIFGVDALENLTILSPSDLPNHLVIILLPVQPINTQKNKNLIKLNQSLKRRDTNSHMTQLITPIEP